MKQFFSFFLLLVITKICNSQSVINGKAVWGPTPIESRISYKLVANQIDLGKFSSDDIQTGRIFFINKVSNRLLIKVNIEFKDNCGKSYNYSYTFDLAGNESKEQTFDFDFSPCKKPKMVAANFPIIISTHNITINSIEDITQKEENKNADALAKQQKLETDKNQKADEVAKIEAAKKDKIAKDKAEALKKSQASKTGVTESVSTTTSSSSSNNAKSTTTSTSSSSSTTSKSSSSNNSNTEIAKNNAQKKAQEQEANYQKQLSIYNEAMEAAEVKRKADEQQVTNIAEGVTQFASAVIMNIRNEAAKKEERREREVAKRKAELEKAALLLANFLENAKTGNENAIIKVEEAYGLISPPYNDFLKIRNEGYFYGEPSDYVNFITNSYNNFQSATAKKALINYYSNVIEEFNSVIRLHKRKAIGQPILAAILFGGGLILGNHLSEGERNNARINNTVGDYTVSSVVSTVGVLGGGVLLFSGVVHLVRIGQTKSDKTFIEAKSKLGKIQQNAQVFISPSYDFINSNLGIALTVNF